MFYKTEDIKNRQAHDELYMNSRSLRPRCPHPPEKEWDRGLRFMLHSFMQKKIRSQGNKQPISMLSLFKVSLTLLI